MKMFHIDPELRRVANEARMQLEIKRLKVQLKRCKEGIPNNPAWEANWDEHINHGVTKAVADYINRQNAAAHAQIKRPTAPVPKPLATQVAQQPNPAAGPYKRF